MVVRFTWQAREWREAYLLANVDEKRLGGGMPMAYLVPGMMALGGVGDVVQALRAPDAVLADSLTPALLLVAGLSALAAAALAVLRRRERFRDLPALPEGEQQVTMHEFGWESFAAGSPVGPVHAWSELYGQRVGRRVLALLTCDGSTVGVPLRVLDDDQGGWVERMLVRKVVRGL